MTKIIIFIGLALLIVISACSPRINSFKECANAGYPIMESYPRQCRTPDGRTFVEEIEKDDGNVDEGPACKDRCGDGQCQEIVCLAIGCPCQESAESCPEDCKKTVGDSKRVSVTVPGSFSLEEGQTAYISNYQEMTITLDSIIVKEVQIVCVTTPCNPLIEKYAQISVSTPGGCGPNADPRCLGPPAYSYEFTIKEWESAQALGVNIEATNIESNEADFEINFISS